MPFCLGGCRPQWSHCPQGSALARLYNVLSHSRAPSRPSVGREKSRAPDSHVAGHPTVTYARLASGGEAGGAERLQRGGAGVKNPFLFSFLLLLPPLPAPPSPSPLRLHPCSPACLPTCRSGPTRTSSSAAWAPPASPPPPPPPAAAATGASAPRAGGGEVSPPHATHRAPVPQGEPPHAPQALSAGPQGDVHGATALLPPPPP